MTPPPQTVFSHADSEGFEQVVFCYDRHSGLRAIISVHDTTLGPSLGGCRFYTYPDEDAALNDVLRLSQAMTYKASLAGLALGGGKAVIMGNPAKDKTEELWQAYASFVDRLSGTYITTVDSGTTAEDMNVIRKYTNHVVGMSPEQGGSGDPSPTTALGVAEGIRASAKFVFGSDNLSGRRVAMQGLGNVGFPLAKRLRDMGASLIVTDTKQDRLKQAVSEFGAEVVGPVEILSTKCDVFAPCAMGGVISEENIPKLKCAIVAGAANNQLSNPEAGKLLNAKGIAYAPDFAINAGGLIHVASECKGFDAKAVEKQTMKIYDTITSILKRARDEKKPSSEIAVGLAKERLKKSA